MMNRALTTMWAAFTAFGFASAAGAGGPLEDPFGDAQDTLGEGPPLLDIHLIDVSYNATTLFFRMTFFTPISAPSRFLPDSVIGFLDFDTDQNPFTGIEPVQNFYSPPFAYLEAGVDFYLDLLSEFFHPGFVELVNADFEIVAVIPISYEEMSFSWEIPLDLLGGDDGLIDFVTLIGTFLQPTDATDVVGTSYQGCPADLDGDGLVGSEDLIATLAAWGNKGGPEDLDGSGIVDFDDLLIVLDSWGPCDPDAVPADNCEAAPVAIDGSYPYSTLNASTDGPSLPPECDEGNGVTFRRDVWIRYAASCTGIATASVCDSDFNTKLAVYDVSACPGELIACSDDACGENGTRSEVTFPVVQGEQYLVRIGGRVSIGTGTLVLSCEEGAH